MERSPNRRTLLDTGITVSGEPPASAIQHPVNDTRLPPPEFPVIPPDHPFRTLVLCFDGTGDEFNAQNSNIVQYFSMLGKGDRTRQMVYYQSGIGTYTTSEIATPLMAKISKIIDSAVAWNLDAHGSPRSNTYMPLAGYEFLMQNYTAKDRICIFGFSRGAYTARSLAGMIHKVGLLPACNHHQVPFAYMYADETEQELKQSNAFKKTFSIDVDIEFIGVRDTVNSVGLVPRQLLFTMTNTIVRTFRQAISLDERRAKFQPNLWNRPNEKEKLFSISEQQVSQLPHAYPPQPLIYARDRTQPTDVDEVWFSDCHSDIGGGSVDNETDHSLARIPLRWMIRECFKTHSGIMFDCAGLKSIGLDPGSLYPDVAPRPPAFPVGNLRIRSIPSSKNNFQESDSAPTNGVPSVVPRTEEELDLQDALSPVYDQLSSSWLWWILELLPLQQHYQREDDTGRFIAKQKKSGIRVHRTVKTRLEALSEHGEKYTPKAAFYLDRTTWVD
ncbi:hypothetical protein DFH09DRAFT_1263481 [Mycena vulgaris]|nr:hypothetical protein DFH09DRAFT_1263481 [Mycena vulgaris]